MSLRLQAVAKRYGGTSLFESLDLVVGRGEKMGLIGHNGSGKSTLLKLIAGLERPDAGTIAADGTVSFLEQRSGAAAGEVLHAIMPRSLAAAAAELEAAQASLALPSRANLERYAAAEERYRSLGGYEFASRAESVLAGLDVGGAPDLARLSGGQRRRVMLARQLLEPADVMLLDEPTNHLDAPGLRWLEEWLRSSDATVLVVSHDRAFLDATVTSIAELQRGTLTVRPGNYSEAMALQATERAAQQRLHDARAREERRLREEVGRLASAGRSAARFDQRRAGNQALILAKNKAENVSRTLAGRAKALGKRLERLEVPSAPFDDGGPPRIPLPDVPSGPGDVLRFEGVSLERGGKVLVRDLDLLLRRGEKLALVGPNGSGKSSFLAMALGLLPPTAGRVVTGAGLACFRAGQHGEELRDFTTLEEAVLDAQPRIRRQDLFHLLARLGLPTDPAARVSELSGGQRTRLALARLTVTRAPLLVLDEPTNDLDVGMVEALEALLRDFTGSVLFASHDRRLVGAVADRTLTLPAVERAWNA